MDGLLVVAVWLVVVYVELALLVALLALFRRFPKGALIVVAANNHKEGMVSADRMPIFSPEN